LQEKAVGSLVAAKNMQLTPEVPGQIATILVRDGSLVKAGAPLIQLDDVVNKAKATSAKAKLTYSEGNYHRMQLLIKKGAISQQAVDQALADLKEKKAIEQESRVLAEKMLIVAPFDGVLGKVKVSTGEHVEVGQPLVSLTDIQNLRVEFNVSEKYLAKLKIGQQVTLTTSAFPGKEFYGKVSYIAPTINTEDHTISIYADVPNQDRMLTAGLFVNVVHLMGEEANVLFIPAVSLVATIDGQQVYKIVDGKAVSVPVKIGHRTTDKVQIMQGLMLDDVVVISGQHKLKDGTSVKLKI
jgi:membrane fusion protein (multidrug efflux system)